MYIMSYLNVRGYHSLCILIELKKESIASARAPMQESQIIVERRGSVARRRNKEAAVVIERYSSD